MKVAQGLLRGEARGQGSTRRRRSTPAGDETERVKTARGEILVSKPEHPGYSKLPLGPGERPLQKTLRRSSRSEETSVRFDGLTRATVTVVTSRLVAAIRPARKSLDNWSAITRCASTNAGSCEGFHPSIDKFA